MATIKGSDDSVFGNECSLTEERVLLGANEEGPPAANSASTDDWARQRTITWNRTCLHPKSLLQYAKRASRAGTGSVAAVQPQKRDVILGVVVILSIKIVMIDQTAHVQVENR